MAIDGLTLHAVINGLDEIIGGKIDKIQQPEKDTLLFSVRAGGKNFRLIVCVHAENGRVQLTERSFQNPIEAPAFCMLLRRRLTGAVLENITQSGLDRYCIFSFRAKNELSDPILMELHVELMGKYSNAALVENGVIVDCIRRVTPFMSSVRTLLPGLPFTPPPEQDKKSIFSVSEDEYLSVLSSPNAPKALQSRFAGLSRVCAEVLTERCATYTALMDLLRLLETGCPGAWLRFSSAGEPRDFWPFPPDDDAVRFDTFTEALDAFYLKRDTFVHIHRQSASLRQVLETHLRRRENTLAAYNETLLGRESIEQDRLFGELLTADLYRMKKGPSAHKVVNYYTDPPEETVIPLNPLLGPSENAQQYFRRYRRKKAALSYAEKMHAELTEEIAYLEGQLDNIEKCDTSAELSEIRDEMIAEGYVRPERKGPKTQKQQPSRPMVFEASDGTRILVGKNNRQNDELTLHASGSRLWLHTKDIPGSHVIVECDGMPSDTVLTEAAQLAAYFSRARHSSSVPVDYTLRKNVKKPSGAKPGMVIYTTNRTIYVTPDEKDVTRLSPEKGTTK